MALDEVMRSVCKDSVVEESGHGFMRIINNGVVIPVAQLALPVLQQQLMMEGVLPEEVGVDPYEYRHIDPVIWTPVPKDEVDPENGTYKLHSRLGRLFVCKYFVPMLLRMFQLSTGSMETRVFDKLSTPEERRPYFVYLAVRSGLGRISPGKKKELGLLLLNRKVDFLFNSQTSRPIPAIQQNPLLTATVDTTELQQQLTDTALRLDQQEARLKSMDVRQDLQTDELQLINDRQNQQEQNLELIRVELNEGIKDQATSLDEIRRSQASMTDQLARSGSSFAQFADITETRFDQLLSINSRNIPLEPLEPSIVNDYCKIQIYLRMRNGDFDTEAMLAGFNLCRKFTGGEPTDTVSRGVTRGLSASVPFIIGLVGPSGGGKTYSMFSVGGILETALKYVPPVEISVFELLKKKKSLGVFQCSHAGGEGTTIGDICREITERRDQAPTPANEVSSRTHLLIRLEDFNTNELYGVIADIAGDEESVNRGLLGKEQSQVSSKIATNNSDFRMMIQELVTPGKGKRGFVDQGVVSNFKRASSLNLELSDCLKHMKGLPLIKLLYCVDGAYPDIVVKTLKLAPTVEG